MDASVTGCIHHLEEGGGCGHEWYTAEVSEDILRINDKTATPQIISKQIPDFCFKSTLPGSTDFPF